MRFLVLLALVGLAAAQHDFLSFSKTFGKSFKDSAEFVKRRAIFNANYQRMVEHNKRYVAGEESWFMKVTEDMDLTPQEFKNKRLGGLPAFDKDTVFIDNINDAVVEKMAKMPVLKEFNWVDQGKVSSVKDQGQCGSCAAFAAMGAIEACSAINSVMADDLSEQHILDCAYGHEFIDAGYIWSADGCDGAWPETYLDWLRSENSYNQEESAYSYTSGYTGDITTCNPSSSGYNKNFKVTGMHNKFFSDESDMTSMLQMNPVITAVSANNDWSYYGGGVLDSSSCCDAAYDSNCINEVNHAVLVVGYGTEEGKDYWLIKNSWSARWGEKGFIKVKRGTGHCAVGSFDQAIPLCG